MLMFWKKKISKTYKKCYRQKLGSAEVVGEGTSPPPKDAPAVCESVEIFYNELGAI